MARLSIREGCSLPIRLQLYETTDPPSQVMTSPTVKPQALELKNIAKPAMSSAVPTLPRGLL